MLRKRGKCIRQLLGPLWPSIGRSQRPPRSTVFGQPSGAPSTHQPLHPPDRRFEELTALLQVQRLQPRVYVCAIGSSRLMCDGWPTARESPPRDHLQVRSHHSCNRLASFGGRAGARGRARILLWKFTLLHVMPAAPGPAFITEVGEVSDSPISLPCYPFSS